MGTVRGRLEGPEWSAGIVLMGMMTDGTVPVSCMLVDIRNGVREGS